MKVIDKIRSMSTEEVAQVIYKFDMYDEGGFDKFCRKKLVINEDDELQCPYNYDCCQNCIKEWLESEAEE